MTPLRILARRQLGVQSFIGSCPFKLVPVRNSGYYNSPFLEDMKTPSAKYEVSKNSEEWKFVERVLPAAIIPEPVKRSEYPSGWKPQAENLSDNPYFVARTKNHMIPVYLVIKQFGVKRLTYIRKIQGDIWHLHKDILEFLQKDQLRPIRSQVNEFAGYICINGDYVNAVKYWLEQRNF